MNFAVLWPFAKVFSAKFGRGVIWCDTSKQTVKIVFFTNSRKFSPSKVSGCTIIALLSIDCPDVIYSSSVHIARCTVYLK